MTPPISRRGLVRWAAAAVWTEPMLAQSAIPRGPIPEGMVRIDSNENPLGPCAEAVEAIHAVERSGRYFFEMQTELERAFAASEGVRPGYVRMFAGSSPALHQAVLAFTSARRGFVVADPGYEAGIFAAAQMKVPVARVPLARDHSHDVEAMAVADGAAGLIYLCNPNNPTGTLTPRPAVEWLLAHKPAGSILMIDEAYIHFSGEAGYIPLAAARADVIVLRTFSKIYGMAGLRMGAAIAHPDLLASLGRFSITPLPVPAMAAAIASLKVPGLVARRRAANAEVRDAVCAFLARRGFPPVPSVSNKFMVDVRRPAGEAVAALAREKVLVGRVWQARPTHIRVTVGTRAEMDRFQDAFAKVFG